MFSSNCPGPVSGLQASIWMPGLGELVPDGGDQVLVEAAAVDAVGVGPGPDRLQPPAGVPQRGEVAAEDVELVLDPDLRLEAVRAGPVDHAPEQDPRVERHRLSLGEVIVAEHADRARMPRQPPRRAQVRLDEDVRKAVLLAGEVQRVRRPVRRLDQFLPLVGVLGVGEDEDHIAERDAVVDLGQEVGHAKPLAAPDSVRVGSARDHGMDALGLAPPGEIVAAGWDPGRAHDPPLCIWSALS